MSSVRARGVGLCKNRMGFDGQKGGLEKEKKRGIAKRCARTAFRVYERQFYGNFRRGLTRPDPLAT